MTMNDLYDQLAADIGRQRKPVELVPVISREEAYQTYADALRRSVATLTETEKRTAFLNHVMEKLKDE